VVAGPCRSVYFPPCPPEPQSLPSTCKPARPARLLDDRGRKSFRRNAPRSAPRPLGSTFCAPLLSSAGCGIGRPQRDTASPSTCESGSVYKTAGGRPDCLARNSARTPFVLRESARFFARDFGHGNLRILGPLVPYHAPANSSRGALFARSAAGVLIAHPLADTTLSSWHSRRPYLDRSHQPPGAFRLPPSHATGHSPSRPPDRP